MKRLIALACLTVVPQIAQAQTVPDNFDSMAALVMIAIASQSCGLRDQQWSDDLLADAQHGEALILEQAYPGGVPPDQAAYLMTYLLKKGADNALTAADQCQKFGASPFMAIGDQAVQHYRSGT